MAYATPRSANAELNLGMVDGTYKMGVKDRGGVVENATWYARDELCHNIYYNIGEAEMFDAPDGHKFHSPYAVEPCTETHNNPSMAGVAMYQGR